MYNTLSIRYNIYLCNCAYISIYFTYNSFIDKCALKLSSIFEVTYRDCEKLVHEHYARVQFSSWIHMSRFLCTSRRSYKLFSNACPFHMIWSCTFTILYFWCLFLLMSAIFICSFNNYWKFKELLKTMQKNAGGLTIHNYFCIFSLHGKGGKFVSV